jgi:hypothetical protein
MKADLHHGSTFRTRVSRRTTRRHVMALALAGLLIATPSLAGGHQFSDWGTAVLEGGVNSGAADGCPIESPDGLRLFLASNRDPVGGATDTNDIYVAERVSLDATFGAAVRLPLPVNSTAADFCPTPLSGNRLLFVSARAIAGACGAGDIYFTREHPVRGWETPVNLGCSATGAGPNSAGGEFSPSLVETDEGTLLYYSSPGASGLQDIYVSQMRADGTFAPGTQITELNTVGFNDQMPNVTRDGLEMVFASDRGGAATSFDIYVSTRSTTTDAWSTPMNLGPAVNTSAAETRPSLSGDRERLHFGRLGDIWVSTRTQVTGSD